MRKEFQKKYFGCISYDEAFFLMYEKMFVTRPNYLRCLPNIDSIYANIEFVLI
jgi:hypothetical protein